MLHTKNYRFQITNWLPSADGEILFYAKNKVGICVHILILINMSSIMHVIALHYFYNKQNKIE